MYCSCYINTRGVTHLEQVAISMETLLDLDALSIEEAAGHL
jgi:hypothetical protein